MELKSYQNDVIRHLSSYMECLDKTVDLQEAWRQYWEQQDICVGYGGVPPYQNNIPGVPHICMKVPTGGGKTFMGCAAIKNIFAAMPKAKFKVVVWLVPSDAILSQTVRDLKNPSHPYRLRLERDFAGKVGVYTKEDLLNGQNFSPDTVQEILTFCIFSYNSLRINSTKKDIRKVWQENGNLQRFADFFKDKSVMLADTPETALMQVLRCLSPVTIVDESHNAGSDLSIEMLNNLNPSFILDLTATPRKSSNIMCYVDARQLKNENMVKLPVVVFNRISLESVILDAIQLRFNLEREAKAAEAQGESYIRPIVLFQAQPNIKGKDNETFDKIKQKLVDMGIKEEEIAIKTSDRDDIGTTDLLSQDCKIRYIITVNALKEGWDCPFAYILASLANKTSKVDVEQIVGRILRQPYTRKHSNPLLNTSYVLTSSNDFHATLESVVTGLNQAGFSRKDFRANDSTTDEHGENQQPTTEQQPMPMPSEPPKAPEQAETGMDDFDHLSASDLKDRMENMGTRASGESPNPDVNEIMNQAREQSGAYEEQSKQSSSQGYTGGELGDKLNQYAIQPQYKEDAEKMRIPQFFVESTPDLFGPGYSLLAPENLSKGFSLSGQDAQVNFELSSGETYSVDIQKEGDAVPKYIRLSKSDSDYMSSYLSGIAPEKRVEACVQNIARQISNSSNHYTNKDVEAYVRRVIGNMTEDQIIAMQAALPFYSRKIQKKIEALECVYQEKQFDKMLDSGKITCRPNYAFPPVITPAQATSSVPHSLYEAEKDDMNNFEHKLLDVLAAMPNILWWHRVIERKGFCLNGFINHYPDFVVKTTTGKTVLVEAKGDYLDGDDSKTKLKIGRRWAAKAGDQYRYFMVFDNKDMGMEGAYTIDSFAEMFKDL